VPLDRQATARTALRSYSACHGKDQPCLAGTRSTRRPARRTTVRGDWPPGRRPKVEMETLFSTGVRVNNDSPQQGKERHCRKLELPCAHTPHSAKCSARLQHGNGTESRTPRSAMPNVRNAEHDSCTLCFKKIHVTTYSTIT